MEYYHLHEKDKYLWSSFLQKSGNEIKFWFGSTQEKDKKPFTKLSANGFLDSKSYIYVVPRAGLEPARCYHRGILSPLRLPVPPPRQGKKELEATSGFEPLYKVLQTSA